MNKATYQPAPNMDIAAALNQARQQIDKLDAETLLAHLLEKERSYLRAWPEREIDDTQLHQFQQLVTRRATGEPLAYLTGWKEFWSLLLQVSPATLIPRPETELLVEEALKRIPQNGNWQIADLGTGSGAIALALASERPQCRITASDNCRAALQVAQNNAQRLGLKNIYFIEGDWTAAFEHGELFDMIVSNPPYIDAADNHLQHNGLPYEPQQALTPGDDGLSAIRHICEQAHRHLADHGWLLLEHGYKQGTQVRALLSQQGFQAVATLRDLNGNDRLSLGQLNT